MSHEKGHEKRRQFTAEEKATILRRQLADKIPVSDLCEEYKIQPSLFYVWQRQAFENLGVALEDRRVNRGDGAAGREAAKQQQQTIERLEAQLRKKDSIIAFVSEEHLALNKSLGRTEEPMVPPDLRDQVVDFVKTITVRTELRTCWVLDQLAIHPQQFLSVGENGMAV